MNTFLKVACGSALALIGEYAFAAFPAQNISCANADATRLVRVELVDNPGDDTGHYRIAIEGGGVTLEKPSVSLDVFDMSEKLYSQGNAEFVFGDDSGKLILQGSPYPKRGGELRLSGSSETLSCTVESEPAQLDCIETDSANPPVIFRTRHATDLGRTTGYYITTLYELKDDEGLAFDRNAVATLSINHRLLREQIAAKEPIEFKFANRGGAFIVENYVSENLVRGRFKLDEQVRRMECKIDVKAP